VAFCDDLTFIIEEDLLDSNLGELIDVIAVFCESGSDFVVNMDKTTLLSTAILRVSERAVIARSKHGLS